MEFKALAKPSESADIPKQRCTDLCCCVFFALFLSVFAGVAVYGLSLGDPALLLYPFDISGNQCGRPSTEVEHYKYLYYVSVQYPSYSVCVKDCTSPCSSAHLNTWVGSCVSNLGFAFRIKDTNATEYAPEYPATNFLDRFCVPDKSAVKEMYDLVSGKIHDGDAFEWAQDIAFCWSAVLIVLGISLLLSLIYLVLLSTCTWLILMLSIAAVICGLILLGYYISHEAESKYDGSAQDNEHTAMQYLTYACYGLAVLFGIIVFYMWRRIQLAVAIVKCALLFMGEVCSILIVPILSFLVTVGLVLFWALALAFLYSCGSVEHKDQYTTFGNVQWDSRTRSLFYFEAVGFIWIVEFQLLFTQLVLALVVCFWYFDNSRQHHSKICKGIWTALRYHIGSVAFAALILTAAKLVKWLLYYIQKKIYNENFAGNQLVKYFCLCVGCCVQCFERFVQYVDKNALITMAYKSSSFCMCAQEVFELLATNAARFLAIGSVGELMSLVGRACITLGSAAAGFLLITQYSFYSAHLASPVPPTVIFVLVAYCVSSLFLSVFEMTCDCIIIFYIEDEKTNGEKHRMHAPEPLHQFMEEHRNQEDSMCCCWV